jgi:hypothetical protein
MEMENGKFDIYMTIEEAKEEIQKRWNDAELKRKVEEYLGGDIPEGFLHEPRAVLFRNIASPDLEFQHFLKTAASIDLKPYILEYTADKFSTRNSDKLGLCKLAIFEKRNRNGECIVHYNKLVDVKAEDNKKFCEVMMQDGKNLVQYHHDLLGKIIGKHIEVEDMSEWIVRNGGSAVEYYKKFIAFFACHGILFENFVTDDSEAAFEMKAILPAIKEIRERFSLKPLIVPLAPDPENVYWWCYSEEVEEGV